MQHQVCYSRSDSWKIQRFGRTGRKRDGTIHALLSEEREELNIEKAENVYREVQKQISKGELYELYGDVERLLPDHMKPECIEKVVEIQQYVREKNSPKKKGPALQGAKRKRNDDIMRNIPEGASTGFVSVRDLLVKATTKKKKVKLSKDFDACGEDDGTDEDIESGRIMVPPRRTQSAAVNPSISSRTRATGKSNLRKSSTITESKSKRSKPRLKRKEGEPFTKQGMDNSDDVDIQEGAIPTYPHEQVTLPTSRLSVEISGDETEDTLARRKSPVKQTHLRIIKSPTPERALPAKESNVAFVELTDSEHGVLSPYPTHDVSPSPIHGMPAERSSHGDEDMGWLVDDDDDNLQIEIVDSSPIMSGQGQAPLERIQVGDESIQISRPRISGTSASSKTLVDDSRVEFIEQSPTTSSKGKAKQLQSLSTPPEVLASKNSNIPQFFDSPVRQRIKSPRSQSPAWVLSSSPLYPTKDPESMLPPALTRRFPTIPSASVQNVPEPSYPIRPIGHQAKRRRIVMDEAESPGIDEPPPPSQRRLRQMESTPVNQQDKKRPKLKHNKPSLLSKSVNPLFDGEAAHSGDEVSEGCSNSDDMESESDRQFIKDSPLTQVSPSYEQTQIYLRSLMTQRESEGRAGPAFSRPIVRPKHFGGIDGPRIEHHPYGGLPSSSPPADEELDNYEFGSFVVADDDISYAVDD